MKTLGPFQELEIIPCPGAKLSPGDMRRKKMILLILLILFRIEEDHGQVLEPV